MARARAIGLGLGLWLGLGITMLMHRGARCPVVWGLSECVAKSVASNKEKIIPINKLLKSLVRIERVVQ